MTRRWWWAVLALAPWAAQGQAQAPPQQQGAPCEVQLTGDVNVQFSGTTGSGVDSSHYGQKTVPLAMVCQGPEGQQLSFRSGAKSKPEDVPFGPKKYEVAGTGDSKQAGKMVANISLGAQVKRGAEVGKGWVDVTRFDAQGIEGTFEFKAKSAGINPRAPSTTARRRSTSSSPAASASPRPSAPSKASAARAEPGARRSRSPASARPNERATGANR